MRTIHYPNLNSFMKRHGLTIGDIAKAIDKSYPPTHQKINRKTSACGKVAMFDIEEAKKIIEFVKNIEQLSLKKKFGDGWQQEWDKRWGHIVNWFEYIFFDEVVTNVNKSA